jgi:hypothetical protein
VAGILGVPSHPLREHDMAAQQLLGITAVPQPALLCGLVDVEKTHRDVDTRRRGCGEHLARRHRITCEQEVASVGVEPTGTGDGARGHPLSPCHVRDRGHRPEVLELDAFDRRCEVDLDGTSGRGLARTAGTRERRSSTNPSSAAPQPVFALHGARP